jgi:hypothetical protein
MMMRPSRDLVDGLATAVRLRKRAEQTRPKPSSWRKFRTCEIPSLIVVER